MKVPSSPTRWIPQSYQTSSPKRRVLFSFSFLVVFALAPFSGGGFSFPLCGPVLFSKKNGTMIYLRNNDSAQVALIPKNITGTGALFLSLRNTLTLAEYGVGNVADTGDSALYWRIVVSLPEGLDNGEYEPKKMGKGTCRL